MARERLGKKPARYLFLLNPYKDVRLSKCPKCGKATHNRKFALLIHINGWGPLAQGKTCRYCSHCKLIMAHKDELDEELARGMTKVASEAVGRDYTVLGTLDRNIWKRGLEGEAPPIGKILENAAQFRGVMRLEVSPGGWYPAGKSPPGRSGTSGG